MLRYKFSPTKLKSEKAKKYMSYATIATAIHNLKPEWINSVESFGMKVVKPNTLKDLNLKLVSQTIESNHERFFDPESGLKAMIVENGNEVIITFGALGAASAEFPEQVDKDKIEKQIWKGVVYNNLFGGTPKIYTQAEKLVLAIKNCERFQNKNFTLVGHCMGGSLASYVGIKNQIPAIGINTLALGAGLQRKLGTKKIRDANRYITHLSVEDDFFSDCKSRTILDVFISCLGVKTPGNFGKHYRIPAAVEYTKKENYSDRQKFIHNCFVGSLMEYVIPKCEGLGDKIHKQWTDSNTQQKHRKFNRVLPSFLKDAGASMQEFSPC